MIYLLLSIISSTLIFVAFRLFERKGVDTLAGIVFNYYTAALLGFVYSPFEISLARLASWNYIPVGLGVLFIVMFFVMARSTQTSGVTVTGIAVKMSLIIPVIAGVLLYDEQLHLIDMIGIGIAIVAVVMSVYKTEKGVGLSPLRIVLPLILFVGSGVVDASIKYAQHTVLNEQTGVHFTSSVFLFAGLYGSVVLLIRNLRQRRSLRWKDVMGGIGLGIPNFGSIYFLILVLSLPNWPSSQMFPLNHVGVVIASAITGVLLFGEKLNGFNRIGLILSVIAIFIISYF